MGWACAPRLRVEALPPSVMIFGGDRVQARSRVGWVSLLCPQLSSASGDTEGRRPCANKEVGSPRDPNVLVP